MSFVVKSISIHWKELYTANFLSNKKLNVRKSRFDSKKLEGNPLHLGNGFILHAILSKKKRDDLTEIVILNSVPNSTIKFGKGSSILLKD